MAQLKLGAIKDLGGIGGFTLTSGGVTANGTLTVNDLVIDGTMGGSSSFVLPNPSGQSGRFVTNNGSSLSWGDVNLSTGIRSMQVWTSNGTWSRPSGVKTIMVTVTGAGGGGSGFTESGGAGGTAKRVIDVTNVSSVSVTVTEIVSTPLGLLHVPLDVHTCIDLSPACAVNPCHDIDVPFVVKKLPELRDGTM